MTNAGVPAVLFLIRPERGKMGSEIDFDSAPSYPLAAQAAGPFFQWAATAVTPAELLDHVLPLVGRLSGSDSVALVRGEKGDWRTIGRWGAARPLPLDLLADVLDAGGAAAAEGWIAAPLASQGDSTELLAIRRPASRDRSIRAGIEALGALLGHALRMVRDRRKRGRRIQQLEAILEIAGQWRQTLEMDKLLQQMAEASTQLLDAERASIFLWDKPNRMLVGRPALGVEGGELLIPDDTGVVGQVVHTGQPRRVDADIDQDEIDRQVDRRLGFQTRSLLCVPLRGESAELFGAFEMVNKRSGDFTEEDQAALTELAAHAAVALEGTQQYEQLLKSRNQMADQAAEGVQLLGQCPAIQALRSTVRRVADTNLAILILGENGTGKEIVARRIHYLSRRRNEPVVAVNCAALTETLLESELFGHEKGAFTDAHESRAGKFELASGGTLFLDEIGDMSPSGQAKLLRVLEEKIVVRVGGSTPIHTDARVIAATNQDLAQMVRNKGFREDLYFRINVVTIELPPLRERGDDILLLADYLLHDLCAKARRKPPRLMAGARKRLRGHAWPGNVRELRNLMERLAYLFQGDRVTANDLDFILSPHANSTSLLSSDLPLNEATRRFQAEYIHKQIERSQGNMSDAARRLGLHRSNLYRKMRQLGVPADDA